MIGRVLQVQAQVSERPPTQLSHEMIVVDGVRVRYVVAGSGPALVFVHGLVGSSRNWNQNIAALARFRTVYAPDLVNMGASERVAGIDPGLEAQVDRLTRWMDAVGIGAADIVGHSHGGAISIRLAARHPGRVRRLVLFAPANPYCNLGGPQIRFYATRIGGVFARRIIPLLPRILYRRSLERLYGDPRRIQPGILEGYTDGLDSSAIGHIVEVMRGWDGDMALVEASLPQLAQSPPLLIWGDRDRAVSPKSGGQLAQRLGARLLTVPGTGHVPFEEKPEECNEALVRWLIA